MACAHDQLEGPFGPGTGAADLQQARHLYVQIPHKRWAVNPVLAAAPVSDRRRTTRTPVDPAYGERRGQAHAEHVNQNSIDHARPGEARMPDQGERQHHEVHDQPRSNAVERPEDEGVLPKRAQPSADQNVHGDDAEGDAEVEQNLSSASAVTRRAVSDIGRLLRMAFHHRLIATRMPAEFRRVLS